MPTEASESTGLKVRGSIWQHSGVESQGGSLLPSGSVETSMIGAQIADWRYGDSSEAGSEKWGTGGRR